jgi:hypothetical protein
LKTALLLVALALSLPLARASQQGGAGAPPAQEEPGTPLHAAMEALEQHLGHLRRALREDATDVELALASVAAMEEATLRAKQLVPPLVAAAPEAERAGLLCDYRKMQVELLAAELKLEAALLEGDLVSARALFKEVRAFEDTGHERFTEDG